VTPTQPPAPTGLWQHSSRDALLVGASLVHAGALVAAWWLHRAGAWWSLVVVVLLNVFLVCTNFQCIAHNFLHLPFFRSRWLNHAFSVWNSILLGMPQTAYKHHHLNHHRGNSDYPDPQGSTRDRSSIYRFSRRPGRAESIVWYSLLSPVRTDVRPVLRDAARHGETPILMAETGAILVEVGLLAWAAPWFLATVWLPIWYLGQVASFAVNYLEHVGAEPGNRKTDAVSCSPRWYNWIWFNNGYPQEHPWRPQVHWTQVPTLTPALPDQTRRRVVARAHWFNWPRRDRGISLP